MFLSTIEKIKREEVERRKRSLPIEVMEKNLERIPLRNFYSSLFLTEGISIIAEVKKSSPSRGVIIEEYNPVSLAKEYEKLGAKAVSVLTEEKYFKGDIKHLEEVKKSINLPVLRKDFILDRYQVYESRFYGADCILLISRLLSSEKLIELVKFSLDLGMEVIVEIHTQEDLKKALLTETRIIGINHRDLDTFHIDLSCSFRLIKSIPADYKIICESGIRKSQDLVPLINLGIRCFLIGEAFLTSSDRKKLFTEFLAARR